MRRNNCQFDIDGTVCFAFAAAILLLPLRLLLAAFIAAGIHELGHYLALKLGRVEVHSIRIGLAGAVMSTGPMSPWTEALCALAGPLCGGALIFLAPVFPEVAVCAFVQTMFNLLPIFPLDGGRVLRRLFVIFLRPGEAEKACLIAQIAGKAALCVLSIYFALELKLGMIPILAVLLICGKKDLAN